MNDKKKVFLYATPLAFVFGIVFGTLFIAYVVTAQTSYFTATNFVFEGGSIQNVGGANVAMEVPQGAIGFGKTPDHTNYRLDVAGDINADDSLTAQSITGEAAAITTLNSADVNITTELNVDGESYFAGNNYKFEITHPTNGTAVFNLSDLFNVLPPAAVKQWWDGGQSGSWIHGHVYDDDPTYGGRFDMTAAGLCSGEQGRSSHNVGPYYQVRSNADDEDTWHRVICVTNPVAPCCGFGVPDGCMSEL